MPLIMAQYEYVPQSAREIFLLERYTGHSPSIRIKMTPVASSECNKRPAAAAAAIARHKVRAAGQPFC